MSVYKCSHCGKYLTDDDIETEYFSESNKKHTDDDNYWVDDDGEVVISVCGNCGYDEIIELDDGDIVDDFNEMKETIKELYAEIRKLKKENK